jgi:uncharacterized alkaline shock family protein YloU
MLDAGSYKMRAGVLELIAGIALSGVEEACAAGVKGDRREDVRKRRNVSKGIRAEVEGDRVTVYVEVNMDYGKNFVEVAGRIQEEVKKAVETMTGWDVDAVDVDVVGVNAL